MKKQTVTSCWEEFIEHCEKRLGISRNILDLISISSILDLAVRGFSNEHIAEYLRLDIKYVINILKSTVNFSGFKTVTDSNPFILYNKVSKQELKEEFENYLVNKDEIQNLIDFCIKYKKIERQLDEYYGD